MGKPNQDLDQARLLLEQIEPDLLEVLRRAPEYGSCGMDVVLYQGKITRTVERREETRQHSKSCQGEVSGGRFTAFCGG